MYFHGNRNSNKVALTFDDGPSEETEEILDALKENDSKATFFIWGERIKGREKIVKRIIKEDNEIGNHSYSHRNLWFKSKEFIEKDIKRGDSELERIGIKTDLFRFPSFRLGTNSFTVCKNLKKKVIFADIDSKDWKKPGIEKVVKKVSKQIKPGSIIDFHDYLQGIGYNKEIVPIVKRLIPKLKNKYKLVTISKLLEL